MNDKMQFDGFERRRKERRTRAERREEIRFELSKAPRRKGHGRRAGESVDVWSKDLG